MVRCHEATASSSVAKVRSEVFAYIMKSPSNVTAVCGIDSLACQDEFFVIFPFEVNENDEHALDFVLHLSLLFRSR
jgi:hypothetical protein